jgi:hypothetical protein
VTEETASIVLYTGLAVAVVWWLIDLTLLMKDAAQAPEIKARSQLRTSDRNTAWRVLEREVAQRGHVVERNRDRLKVEFGPVLATLELQKDIGGLYLHCRLELTKLKRAFILVQSLFTLILAPAAIVIAYLLLSRLAVPSERPGVRPQVVQVVQTVHFLWPPLLVRFIGRRARRQAESILDNLPAVIDADTRTDL